MRRRIIVLGATGSVGRSTVDLLLRHRDRFEVTALVGHRDAAGLAALARQLNAGCAVLADESQAGALREALGPAGIAAGAGSTAVLEAVERECDIVVGAIAGTAGLRATHAALKPGRTLALANKETLVCAGEPFMRDARERGVPILPVDSEHNALLQALGGQPVEAVERMTITASGGPFRTWSAERLLTVTPEQALAHPTWSMGAKISIDSATLMNKGLELIEAMHLFAIAPERLDAVIHPQSVVHGLVAFRDGAVTAGLAMPDMRVPIAYCLGLPERLDAPTPRLDLAALGSLTFEVPDVTRFPALALARAAMMAGGAMPAILNAANEIAVAAFLDRRLAFHGIPALVEEVCARLAVLGDSRPGSVDEALEVDQTARRVAEEVARAGQGGRVTRPHRLATANPGR
ncbi:1-deoxy-D-xylulose-5-phosphate reductoisomerase [Chelatococcus reniformis]|uniref:1-deoxy-D-xylulose 5-phosphate reductoisomerase n=1 Tax=Chelatococcus reniformis TaxID=1494448 RepID=A0A916XFF6_9HYPH|nr:1-deoxy-D-xylulose-5-phosphate reductoisomerase [Chelatococcus reniformis]GGC69438.1 1-deoxy-D-xylulose 5-phosphate reductoisomerase [Chelatococcus reniformis]